MKYIKTSVAAVSMMALMSSCNYYDRFEEPEFDVNAGKLEATTTFAELKAEYIIYDDSIQNQDESLQKDMWRRYFKYFLFDNEGHAKYSEVFNGYSIPDDADEIINAIVVSSDVQGNTYKKIVLQDLKDGSAMDLSIDAGSLSGVFPRGQRVSLVASGWDIGDYAESPVLGYRYENKDPKRNRKEIGRVPFPFVKEKMTAWGMPDTTLIKVDTLTITEIKAGGRNMYGRVVFIKDVELGYYVDSREPVLGGCFESDQVIMIKDQSNTIPFAYENDLGVPVSRALVDATGARINLSTSSFSKFASDALPSGMCNVMAIVGWYRDQPAKDGSYQLALQRREDLVEIK